MSSKANESWFHKGLYPILSGHTHAVVPHSSLPPHFPFFSLPILFQHCKTHSLFSKFCMAILPSHLLFLIPISYHFAPFQHLMICFALPSKWEMAYAIAYLETITCQLAYWWVSCRIKNTQICFSWGVNRVSAVSAVNFYEIYYNFETLIPPLNLNELNQEVQKKSGNRSMDGLVVFFSGNKPKNTAWLEVSCLG